MGIQQRIQIFIVILLIIMLMIISSFTGVLQKLWDYYDIYCIIFPVGITIISIMAYIFIMNGDKREENRLKIKGIPITAKVLGVIKSEVRTFDWFLYDGNIAFGRTYSPLYRVRCLAEKDGKILDLVSDYTALDPTPLLKETVTVYLDKKNPAHYRVDLDELKELGDKT